MPVGLGARAGTARELVAAQARPGGIVLTVGAGDVDARRAARCSVAGRDEVEEGVALSRLHDDRHGRPGAVLRRAGTLDELVELLAWAASEGASAVARSGWARTCSSPTRASRAGAEALRRPRPAAAEGELLVAGGGASLAVCLHRARDAGLGGLEFACAIPGTVGGAVWMNAGAYGSDISRRARARARRGRGRRGLARRGRAGPRYRRSELERGQVVARASCGSPRARSRRSRRPCAEMQARRKEAQPTNKRTFGSVFKNPEHELTAGRMLEACGLRGFAIGGACISPKHANFIENAGGATSRRGGADRGGPPPRAREFGAELEHEVEFLGGIELPQLPGH